MKKHLTKAERTARSTAESELDSGGQRKRGVSVIAPGWLSVEARKVFNATKRKLRGQGLLESVDADLLGMYADAVARYRAGAEALGEKAEPKETAAVQAWSRLALTYAEKLGIGPNARARLAKKKAENNAPVDPMAALLGGVADYVNGTDGNEQ